LLTFWRVFFQPRGVLWALFCDASNVIGFVFPTYMSFKAIESEAKEDDKQWCVARSLLACFVFLRILPSFADGGGRVVVFLLCWILRAADYRLTYWVVYAGFNVFEVFSDYLLYWYEVMCCAFCAREAFCSSPCLRFLDQDPILLCPQGRIPVLVDEPVLQRRQQSVPDHP
jgi:hypothetical protein